METYRYIDRQTNSRSFVLDKNIKKTELFLKLKLLRIIPRISRTYSYNIEVTAETGMNGLKCDLDDTSFSNCVEKKMEKKLACIPPWLGM